MVPQTDPVLLAVVEAEDRKCFGSAKDSLLLGVGRQLGEVVVVVEETYDMVVASFSLVRNPVGD